MEISVIRFIILGVISGLTKGAGVLPAGPLNAAVGGTVMFNTTVTPTENPFVSINWNVNDRLIITSTSDGKITTPEYEGRITLFTSTGSLELRNLALNDSGEYRVNITQEGASQMTGSIRLEVLGHLPFLMCHRSDCRPRPDCFHLFPITLCIYCLCLPLSCFVLFVCLSPHCHSPFAKRKKLCCHPDPFTSICEQINSMNFPFEAGLCYGAGVLTVDLLRGAAGKSVTFATSVKPTTEPFMALLWTFSGTINIITSTSADIVGQGYEGRIILDKSTGSLVLKNVTEKDSGEYELIIIPYGAEQIQGTAKLEVQTTVSVPTIACPTENPTEGTTSVNLTCDADGSASTRVWMKDGQPLVSGKRFSFYDGNRVLSISPVDRSDAGEFLCNVSNDLSSATAKCQLTVYYGPDRPTISQWPIREELEESVTLICSAASLPKATFFWKFKHMQMNGPVHYIHEMEMMHLGRYTCTARNPVTGLEASVFHTLSGI
ncbi:carcinoembryonic antigen-related cell adhesion molecule 2-like [Larimichthys crocea]|uniref:carcinoembryonic antigen-related cell adhesion molecule 2-like n=1 Tax=Larimichthys crocea TaxID=215358 RepID=UPI000F5FD381|nr:carcinoembryonic antigen-related cell adhesion molecule 2-like [Larimichthys crocea]